MDTFHLRNRKHVPCFYRVIETRVKVWKNEKCCGNTSRRRVFPQLFRVLPNFHECFYNPIGTRKVWENSKCCGNTSRRRVFPQLFRVLPNFHECFYNSIGTRRTCFLFLLENTATKKKEKQLVYFDHKNVNSLCSRHHYVNSSC